MEGYVYVLKNPAFEEEYLKIGRTTKNPKKRAEELFTTGLPERFEVVYQEMHCF